MVIINIERYKEKADMTFGKVSVTRDGKEIYKCYSIEPAGEDCVERGKDRRIPQGEYKTFIRYSPRFKKDLRCLFNDDVPSDRHILIHAGNTGKDTEGCILLGKKVVTNGVSESVMSLKELNTLINKDEEVKVVIKNNITERG